jgi:multidrug efflux system membrane fusion protein
MYRHLFPPLACAALAAAWMAAGCERAPAPVPPEPLAVDVCLPVRREVGDARDFTGRTDAVFSTDIRARVTGYLVKMPFREGAEVHKDDLLFEIDPRPYQAQVDRAAADVVLMEAKLKLAKADNARAKNIYRMNPGAISLQDLDKYQAAEEEAVAAVASSKANLQYYKLNLGFCTVTSPIDGMVSRYYFTLGNLANQDQTLLTTVVSVDPVYAYFDVDERTLLEIANLLNKKELHLRPRPSDLAALIASAAAQAGGGSGPWQAGWTAETLIEAPDIPVLLGLQGEQGYPHKGTINFINNKVDPLTGTITVRGAFPNPKGEGGVRLLRGGMFARIRLPLGRPRTALLVADRALVTDQGYKNVFVVDAQNKIRYRRVQPGPLQEDGLRVILEGVRPDDRVAVSNLQMVREGLEVAPVRGPMPTVPAPGPRKPPAGKNEK